MPECPLCGTECDEAICPECGEALPRPYDPSDSRKVGCAVVLVIFLVSLLMTWLG